jgi:hypothetical protein
MIRFKLAILQLISHVLFIETITDGVENKQRDWLLKADLQEIKTKLNINDIEGSWYKEDCGGDESCIVTISKLADNQYEINGTSYLHDHPGMILTTKEVKKHSLYQTSSPQNKGNWRNVRKTEASLKTLRTEDILNCWFSPFFFPFLKRLVDLSFH